MKDRLPKPVARPDNRNVLVVAALGIVIGFVGGLFGRGGASLATPVLFALGVPPAIAVASPLPASIPATAAASWAYRRHQPAAVDRRLVATSVLVGVPATVAGALASRLVDAGALVFVTDLVLVLIGLRLVAGAAPGGDRAPAPASSWRTGAVAAIVGLASGLLANGGGFLLAPLYMTALRRPVKVAFATSLVVALVLAIPGTVVHAALGHIDWTLAVVFAVTSVPLSFVGGRVAALAEPRRLERVYGVGLAVVGAALAVTAGRV